MCVNVANVKFREVENSKESVRVMEEAVFLSIILLLGITDGALAQKGQEREVFQYVNTFVSTGGEGFGYTSYYLS